MNFYFGNLSKFYDAIHNATYDIDNMPIEWFRQFTTELLEEAFAAFAFDVECRSGEHDDPIAVRFTWLVRSGETAAAPV